MRVAVIGAGISGLACARALRDAGVEVVVFEKSRSFGGRCATRLWEGDLVDHGAQYFTMRNEAFSSAMDGLCAGALRILEAPIVDEKGEPSRVEKLWYHEQGNNRIGKAMAAGLDVRMEEAVSGVEPSGAKWIACGEKFDAVVSSAPWPQTAPLLGLEPGLPIFVPCLTAFFAYRGLPAGKAAAIYARKDRHSALAWSACENHKTGRIHGERTVFIVQASPAFSIEHLEAEPGIWSPLLQADLEGAWELDPAARLGSFSHRWRYARRCREVLPAEFPAGFLLTGDSVAESRVESAWLAGQTTAMEVMARTVAR